MKPTIKRGPASFYASANETIREFWNGSIGGLLSLTTTTTGLLVDVYRCDEGVQVRGPLHKPTIDALRKIIATANVVDDNAQSRLDDLATIASELLRSLDQSNVEQPTTLLAFRERERGSA